jgi:hypothetical protein
MVKFTSDSSGNLLAVINPSSVLPAILIDDIVGYTTKIFPGEELRIIAHDERKVKNGDFLWSNEVIVTVTG